MIEKKLSILQRLNKFRKAITVEPVGLLVLTGNLLATTATQTLALEKACRVNLNFSEEVCDAVRNQDTDNNSENERIVQSYVATLLAYKSIVVSVLPCFLLIFAGGWMDITGRRKIILMLTVTGEILAQIGNILNYVFFYQLKVEYLIFSEAIFYAMFGGWSVMFVAILSYVADITTEENRTFRFGVVNFCVFIGMPIGVALSGVTLKNFGYLTVYILSLMIAVTNMSYLTFVLSDPTRTKEHKEHDNRGFCNFMKTFFNPRHFVNSIKVVFKKTQDNRSVTLCVLLGTTCFVFGPIYGESAIVYLSVRYRFGWDELQYGVFQAYNMIIGVIGITASIYVMSKVLGWHDSVLGITSSCSKILAAFVYCFAVTGGIYYLGAFVDFLNGTSIIAIRSIMSKTVEPHELGRLSSIVGIAEVLMPLVYVPLYTNVYTATMEVMPGAVFLVGAAVTVPPLMVFIWFFYRHLKSVRLQKLDKSHSTDF